MDATGKCAVMEWIDGTLNVHQGDEVKIKALTNCTYEKGLEKVAENKDAAGRFATAACMLDSYDDQDPVDCVFSILNAASQESTLWSLVFDARDLRLHYFTKRNPEIRSVTLHDFDLSGDSPFQVLDLNAPGSGDVASGVKPFTHEENARMVRAVHEKWCRKHGDDFSEAEYNKDLEYYTLRETLSASPVTDGPGDPAVQN